jgi:hypothetical protein
MNAQWQPRWDRLDALGFPYRARFAAKPAVWGPKLDLLLAEVFGVETPGVPRPEAPKADPDGPGSILSAFLKSWGFGGCSACSAHARRMDALGAAEILADLDTHVAEIRTRAKLVPEFVIRERVEWACRESLRRKADRPSSPPADPTPAAPAPAPPR